MSVLLLRVPNNTDLSPFFPCYHSPFPNNLAVQLPLGKSSPAIIRVDVHVRPVGFPDTLEHHTTWVVKPPRPAHVDAQHTDLTAWPAMGAAWRETLLPLLPTPPLPPLATQQEQEPPAVRHGVVVVAVDVDSDVDVDATCRVLAAAVHGTAPLGRHTVEVLEAFVWTSRPAAWHACWDRIGAALDLPPLAVLGAAPSGGGAPPTTWATAKRLLHPDALPPGCHHVVLLDDPGAALATPPHSDFAALVDAARPLHIPTFVRDCTMFRIDACQAAARPMQATSMMSFDVLLNYEFVWQRNTFFRGVLTQWVGSPVVAFHVQPVWRCVWTLLVSAPRTSCFAPACAGGFAATVGATCAPRRTALLYDHAVNYDAVAAGRRRRRRHDGAAPCRGAGCPSTPPCDACVASAPPRRVAAPVLHAVFSDWRRFGLWGERDLAPQWPQPCPSGGCAVGAWHVLGSTPGPEHFCVVLWPSSSQFVQQIVRTAQTVGLQVVAAKALNVTSHDHAVRELWAFYAPDGHVMRQHMVTKADRIGTGRMFVLAVRDLDPVYISQLAMSGPHFVNAKVTNLKGHARTETGGDFHASMNVREGVRDALAFFGHLPWCGDGVGDGRESFQRAACAHQAVVGVPAVRDDSTWAWSEAAHRFTDAATGRVTHVAVDPVSISTLQPAAAWHVPGGRGAPWASLQHASWYLNVSVPHALVLPVAGAQLPWVELRPQLPACVQLGVDTSGGVLDALCPYGPPGLRMVDAVFLVTDVTLAALALGASGPPAWPDVPCCSKAAVDALVADAGSRMAATVAAALRAEVVQVAVAPGDTTIVALVQAGSGMRRDWVSEHVQHQLLRERVCTGPTGMCTVDWAAAAPGQ